MSEFKREDRYIVVKRKDINTLADQGMLRPASLDGLEDLCEAVDLCADIPTREYLVIESDWPEYQAVWAMIEARMSSTQPAEAEGVEVVGWLHGYAKAVSSDPVVVSGWLPECVEPLMKVVQHQNILSAVTAERDGLAAARMAYASEFAPDENGDPDVGSVHANIRALKAERDQLRAEVEALRAFVTDCTETAGGMVNGNRLSHRAKELIAAMAAKEE